MYLCVLVRAPPRPQPPPGTLGKQPLRLTSMCSASHPSSLASRPAILRAKHFFPRSELPPYPLPKEMISLRSGRWAMSVSSGLQAQPFTKGSARGTHAVLVWPEPLQGAPEDGRS